VGVNPEFADALERTRRMVTLLENHMAASNNNTVIGTDDATTVEVTINARNRLTDLHIESGLLRLGVDTVARRINEAARNAQAAVTAGNDADDDRLKAQIADIVNEIEPPLRGPASSAIVEQR